MSLNVQIMEDDLIHARAEINRLNAEIERLNQCVESYHTASGFTDARVVVSVVEYLEHQRAKIAAITGEKP